MHVATPLGLEPAGPAGVIRLAGAPREQGREHGRRAREQIRVNLALVRRGMADLARAGQRYDYDAILSRNEAFAAQQAPELLEEIEGIAEGSGVPYRDLLLLNLPLYIVGSHLPLDCSQLLVMPPATRDGKTYLAKTRDFGRGSFEQVVTHRQYAGGTELIEVNTAGSITWPGSGLNSHGVAVSTSGVWSRRTPVDVDQMSRGWLLINSHLLLRDSCSVQEFADRLAAQPRVTGLNIVVADRQRGAAFEVTRDRVVRHDADDAEGGVLVRTNHYLSPEFQELSPTPAEYPHTFRRYAVATGRLHEDHGLWDLEAMTRLVAHHDADPAGSICRHLDQGAQADTVYASVAGLPDGAFWTVTDHPCRTPAPNGATAAPTAPTSRLS